MEEQLTVADIMNEIALHLYKSDIEELVPQMLRAVCKDEHVDAVEEFIRQFDNIDWNWYPNG
jgi:predicted protein tyrosine phosphatase